MLSAAGSSSRAAAGSDDIQNAARSCREAHGEGRRQGCREVNGEAETKPDAIRLEAPRRPQEGRGLQAGGNTNSVGAAA